MNAIEQIAESLSQYMYGKSARLDAPENQNDDFCWGYSVGMQAMGTEELPLILAAWKNYGSPTGAPPEWMDWKRGFHAGRFAAIGATAPAHPQHNSVINKPGSD